MKALFLGGSEWQVDFIRRAIELGVETLVVDIDPKCPGESVGHTFVRVDTNDRQALLAIALEHRVDVVFAEQTDRVVPVAAYLNDALGLPGMRPEVAERFTNKVTMRQALEGKVPMPAFQEVTSEEQALAFADREGYPVVMKPICSQASIGVFKVDDPQALRNFFVKSMTQSQDGSIIVESFVDGPEITVEGFSLDGCFNLLAVSEKEHYEFNVCLARRLSYPPAFGESTMVRIAETAKTVVETLGLIDGISHAEYRIRGGVPFLVEVAARGGGNRVASCIVPHVSGVDVYEVLIRKLQGHDVALPPVRKRAAALEFLDFAPGKVRAVHGLEQIRKEGLAKEIQLAFEPGDSIQQPQDDRRRLGFIIVLGENRDDVDARCARIKELVKVEYA